MEEVGARTYMTGKLGDVTMANWGDDSDQVAGLLRDGRIGSALKEALAGAKVLRIPIAWVLWRAISSSLPPALTPARAHEMNDGPYVPATTEDSIAPAFRRRMGLRDANRFSSRLEAPPEHRKHF